MAGPLSRYVRYGPPAGVSWLTTGATWAWLRPYLGFLVVHAAAALTFVYNQDSGQSAGWGVVPSDDVWIALVYARNFAHSLTFAFNLGQPEAGMTTPLWVVLLGVLYRPMAALGLELPTVAQMLGILLAAGVSVVASQVVTELTGRRIVGLLAGVAIALDPNFTYAKISGSEVALFSLLSMGATWTFMRRMTGATAFLLAGAVLTRPEGFILVALVVAAAFGRRLWERETMEVVTAEDLQEFMLLAAPSALAGAVWALYNISVTGLPFPNGYYVKVRDLGAFNADNLYAIWQGYYRHTVYLSGVQAVVTLGLILTGATYALRRQGGEAVSLVLFPVLLVYAFSILVPFPSTEWTFAFRKYLDPTLPFLVVMLTVGIMRAWDGLTAYVASQAGLEPEARRPLQFTAILVALALVVVPFWSLPWRWGGVAAEFSWSVRNMRDVALPLARWIRENVPPGTPVGVEIPGVMKYLLGDRPLVDLTGLNNHGAIGKRTLDVVDEEQPPYSVVYETLYSNSYVYGRRVMSVETPKAVSVAWKKVAVYANRWTELATGEKDRIYNLPLVGLEMVDSLDVGDEAQELAHDWEMAPLLDTIERTFRTNAETVITDEARVTDGVEQFRVRARAGRDLVIVKRYDAGIQGAVRVFVDNVEVGVWRLPPRDYFFGEDQFTVPSTFIQDDVVLLTFQHIPEPGVTLNSYYYWIFVPAP